MPLFGPPDVEGLQAKGNIKGLMKALGYKKDMSVRLSAIQALVEVEHGDEAIKALIQRGDARAVETLVAVLEEKNWQLRRAAAWALGQIGDTQAVEPLIVALKDSDTITIEKPEMPGLVFQVDQGANVRGAAAEALGRIGDPRAVEPLVAALNDQVRDVQKAVAWALGQIGASRAVEPLITFLKVSPKHDLLRPLVFPQEMQGGGSSSDPENWQVRQAAAWALGQIGDPRAVKPLLDVLGSPRMRYPRSLGMAIKTLSANLGDEHREVRQAAAWALGQICDAQAVEPLIAVLEDETPNIRRAAAEALIGMYRSRRLGDAHKRLILNRREMISQKHIDRRTHTDNDIPDCVYIGHSPGPSHADKTGHVDKEGIGIHFPL